MARIEVRDDGIYEYNCYDTGEYTRLIIQKEALVKAMHEWFGINPKVCEHYKNGYCLNTSQCWAVSCNGFTSKCENGKY